MSKLMVADDMTMQYNNQMKKSRSNNLMFDLPAFLFVYAAIALIILGVSIYLGPDATPDFRIYHYYNGYALLNPRPQDIAAAQLQTYFFPSVDGVIYRLIETFNDRRWLLQTLLAVPAVLAGWAVASLTTLQAGRQAVVPVLACALFGLFGSANLTTLGTSMSELFSGVFVLWALVVLFSAKSETGYLKLMLAGALAGMAIGLKLTAAPAVAGLGIMALILYSRTSRDVWVCAILFGVASVAVFFAISGWWWIKNFQEFGNPTFPMFNNIFRSDMVAIGSWSDDRFKPTTLTQWLAYPAYWAVRARTLVIELPMRDARLLLCLVAAVMLATNAGFRLAAAVRRGADTMDARRALGLAAFVIVSYVFWLYLSSIYRYMAVLEAISGFMLFAAIMGVYPYVNRVSLLLIPVFFAGAMWTQYPWWSRAEPDALAVRIDIPVRVEPDSMVLMLDSYAMSYIVPKLPASVSVIGANTNLVRPGSPGRLYTMIEQRIRTHQGPFWGLENPKDYPGIADQTLAHHRLRRSSECGNIRSNIEDDRIRICRLEKTPAP